MKDVYAQLLYLFELVDTIDSPSVTSVRSCFTAIAGAVTGVSVMLC